MTKRKRAMQTAPLQTDFDELILSQKENLFQQDPLASLKKEICWLPSVDKKPIDPRTHKLALWSNPDVLVSYEEAKSCPKALPGLVLSKGLGIVAFDFDKCIHKGRLSPEVAALVMELDSYTEISSSGTGLHVLARGYISQAIKHRSGIEIYDHNKIITLTEHKLEPIQRPIACRQDVIDRIWTRLQAPVIDTKSVDLAARPARKDEEIMNFVKALHGQRFEDLYYKAIHDNPDVNKDASSKDFALAVMIAPYVNSIDQAERIFNGSKLAQRDKWRIRSDYRLKTLEKAIASSGEAVAITPKKERAGWTPIGLTDFISLDLPPLQPVCGKWLCKGSLVLLYSQTGIGKTYFSLSLGIHISLGLNFLIWPTPQPQRVLYIDGEMPAIVMQERVCRILSNLKQTEASPANFDLLAYDLCDGFAIDLATPEAAQEIEILAEAYDVIILDNLSTLVLSGKENESESWNPIQSLLLKLRKKNKAVILIHHEGKNKSQRGTSKKEIILDVVIQLIRPKDYQPEDGAHFEIHFRKARILEGKDARPLVAKLVDGSWQTRGVEGDMDAVISAMLRENIPVAKIAEELGKDKATIYRHIQKEKPKREKKKK